MTETVAWMTDDGRVASDHTKRTAMASTSKPAFHIALVLASIVDELRAEAESLRAERDTLAKALEPGFMTAVSDGQAARYEVVIKFRDLRSMQDAHNALVRSTLQGDAK